MQSAITSFKKLKRIKSVRTLSVLEDTKLLTLSGEVAITEGDEVFFACTTVLLFCDFKITEGF